MNEVTAPAKAGKQKENRTTPETAVVVSDQNGHGTAIAKATPQIKMVMADLDSGELPDLDSTPTAPLDFASEYWTPENQGEARNMFFSHIDNALVTDEKTGDQLTLPTAHFFWKKGNDIVSVRNASKRLLAALTNGGVQRGMGLEITYLGKKKNSTNAFLSDNWSVKPKITRAIASA